MRVPDDVQTRLKGLIDLELEGCLWTLISETPGAGRKESFLMASHRMGPEAIVKVLEQTIDLIKQGKYV